MLIIIDWFNFPVLWITLRNRQQRLHLSDDRREWQHREVHQHQRLVREDPHQGHSALSQQDRPPLLHRPEHFHHYSDSRYDHNILNILSNYIVILRSYLNRFGSKWIVLLIFKSRLHLFKIPSPPFSWCKTNIKKRFPSISYFLFFHNWQ